MKARTIVLALLVLVPANWGAPCEADAQLLAGWDFDDMRVDGEPLPSTTSSSLGHPTGVTAATLWVTGDVVAAAMPPGRSLRDDVGLQGGRRGFANRFRPTFAAGTTGFESRSGLGITARGSATIEIDATVSPLLSGTHLVLSFGGIVIPSAADESELVLRASFGDGCGAANSTFTDIPFRLDRHDRRRLLWLGPGGTNPCVRLVVEDAAAQPMFDDFALQSLPEPVPSTALAAGASALAFGARRRQSRPD